MSTWFRRTDAGPDLDQRIRRIATRRAKAVVQGVVSRVGQLESGMTVVRVDLERIAHQLRALEQRLDAAASAPPPATTAAEPTDDAVLTDDPAAVLADIRREHERIRVRFQTMTRYEERLRRLEDAVVKLYGGDLRGPGRNGS
jgi:hypothetical protein